MHNLDDEFRFLYSDAARVGRSAPLPIVKRVTVAATQEMRMSGLSFDPDRHPTAVFLHGAGLNAHSFDPAILSLNAPSLSLDLPGHGHSDWRNDGVYRPASLTPDVAGAFNQLISQPVTLVGHSLGGLTAIGVAAAAPHLIRKLVIIDITPGIVPTRAPGSITDFISGKRDFESRDEIVDRAINFGIGHDRKKLARGIALNTRQRDDGRFEWVHHLAHLQFTGDAERPESSVLPPDSGYAALWQPLISLHNTGLPITLVAASAGMVSEAMMNEWRQRLPASTVLTLDGPHNLHEAAPVELANLLRE